MTKSYSLPKWARITKRMLPEYGQWAAMLNRCFNPNCKKYIRYGGRGISVCSRWRYGFTGLSGFDNFIKDMGRRPSKIHSIERVNNDGDYCPGNCVWATNKQQANNRSSNRKITYNGDTLSMMAMAEKYGVSYYVLRNRISRGWPAKEAITYPKDKHFNDPNTAVGERLPQSKLTKSKVIRIKADLAKGKKGSLLANKYRVSRSTISMIKSGKVWAHVK